MIGARLVLALVASLWIFSVGGCRPALTESDAGRLAEQRIQDYAEKENLDRARFGSPTASSERGHPWIFDYTSDTTPRHQIRIYVNSAEDVEIHRMIEE